MCEGRKRVIQPVRGAFWDQRATSPLVPVSDSAHGAPSAPSASLSPPPPRSGYHPDTCGSRKPRRGAAPAFSATAAARDSASKHVHSQLGELLQRREVLYTCDVVVLQEQMREAGGEIQVANVRDLVVVQVKDSEVPAHGDITLKLKT